MASRHFPGAPLAAFLFSACTITRMGAESGPPRIESNGLLEGHAAFGFREDDDVLRVRVLEGESDGALAEFALWKLFRVEVGALGVAVGIGPIDLALGTLFYEPEVPEMIGQEEAREAAAPSAPVETCEICARERASSHP